MHGHFHSAPSLSSARSESNFVRDCKQPSVYRAKQAMPLNWEWTGTLSTSDQIDFNINIEATYKQLDIIGDIEIFEVEYVSKL